MVPRPAVLLLAIALLGLAACSSGTPTQANISRLQTGVTTYDQAVALLGKPYNVDSRGGRIRAIWASAASDGTRSGVVVVFNEKGVAEVIQ
jgi:outer membrane protein assembly factor BamE (lipoprotein component of BamABCDE complex)